MPSILPDRKVYAHRKVVMESVMRQALAVPDWQQHCAELMDVNGITDSDLTNALKDHARVLLFVQPCINIVGWTVFVMTTALLRSGSLAVDLFGFTCSALLCAVFCAVFNAPIYCYLYCPILVWLKEMFGYIPLPKAIILGCLVLPAAAWGTAAALAGGEDERSIVLGVAVSVLASPLCTFWALGCLARPLSPKPTESRIVSPS